MISRTAATSGQFRFFAAEMRSEPKVKYDEMQSLWMNEQVVGFDVSMNDANGMMQCVSHSIHELIKNSLGFLNRDAPVRAFLDEPL